VFVAAAVLSFSALAELAGMVGISRRLTWLFPVCTVRNGLPPVIGSQIGAGDGNRIAKPVWKAVINCRMAAQRREMSVRS
jgi:hypothetical protein